MITLSSRTRCAPITRDTPTCSRTPGCTLGRLRNARGLSSGQIYPRAPTAASRPQCARMLLAPPPDSSASTQVLPAPTARTREYHSPRPRRRTHSPRSPLPGLPRVCAADADAGANAVIGACARQLGPWPAADAPVARASSACPQASRSRELRSLIQAPSQMTLGCGSASRRGVAEAST